MKKSGYFSKTIIMEMERGFFMLNFLKLMKKALQTPLKVYIHPNFLNSLQRHIDCFSRQSKLNYKCQVPKKKKKNLLNFLKKNKFIEKKIKFFLLKNYRWTPIQPNIAEKLANCVSLMIFQIF